MSRRFAKVSAFREDGMALPRRHTQRSAGYDLCAAVAVDIPPRGVALVPTGVKAYMEADEVLKIYIRSSLAVKRQLRLANHVGIIDADYVDNPENEGHIFIPVENLGATAVRLEIGERIAQGIFERYLSTDDDRVGEVRSGGFGSTDR